MSSLLDVLQTMEILEYWNIVFKRQSFYWTKCFISYFQEFMGDGKDINGFGLEEYIQ